MNSPIFRQAINLLSAALERPAHERVDFVNTACGEDATLAREVLTLIEHYQQANSDGFLCSPAANPDSVFDSQWLEAGQCHATQAANVGDCDEILRRISISNLTSSSGILAWWRQTDQGQRPASGLELLAELVNRRMLTAYQAEVLCGGGSDPLVLSNYEILELIAEGGMGRVFMARHQMMNRTVAIKLMGDALDSPDAVRRFRREVETAARLNHPNIVQALDADLDDGTHLLVMEYVNGVDLGRMVRRVGPLPLVQAVDYICQAARALAYAHQHRVVHRDVKPSNMLVDGENVVKILDMGLARIDTSGDTASAFARDEITQDDQVFGTLDYMAPEQATSAKSVDHRADIYSLGCSLYFLLTANPPYPNKSPVAKIMAHREQPIPRLSTRLDSVPDELEELIHNMMAKKPDDRIQSLDEVVHRLEQLRPLLPEERECTQLPTEHSNTDEPHTDLTNRNPDAVSETWEFSAASTDAKVVQPSTEPRVPRVSATQADSKTVWKVLLAASTLAVSAIVLSVFWRPDNGEADKGVHGFTREREFAELVTQRGGGAWILLEGQENSVEIKSPQRLPSEPFYVTSADLRENDKVTDEVLARFRGMPELKELHLNGTNVGDAGVSHLATMKKLRILRLDHTSVTGGGLRHLSSLSNLDELSLGGLSLVDDDLNHIPISVEHLSLANTPITELSRLRRIKTLRWLSLNSTRVEYSEMVRLLDGDTMKDLESLYLQGAQFTDDTVLAISRGLHLREIFFSKTQVSDKGLANIGGQKDLQVLQFDGCPKLTDACMENVAKLRSLRTLIAHDTRLAVTVVDDLKRLTQLQELDIRRTQITRQGYEAIEQALPNCNIKWEDGPPEFYDVAMPLDGDRAG